MDANGRNVAVASVRVAVGIVRLGLVDQRVIEPERWDQAVATLARSRFELQGIARCQVHALFRAVRWDDTDALHAAINELDHELSSPRAEPCQGEQLSLFG